MERIKRSDKGLERALKCAETTREHIQVISERVRKEAEKDHEASLQKHAEFQTLKKELLERTAREIEAMSSVVEQMRLEAQKAIDERKLMEAHAVDMASKAKASRQVADTVREESARELERMEALVAAVQENKVANLKWRDPAMAETVDELIAQYRRQKADAALAKASDSGADAELVEAVNQARKATVRAEEEAEAARRQAAERAGSWRR